MKKIIAGTLLFLFIFLIMTTGCSTGATSPDENEPSTEPTNDLPAQTYPSVALALNGSINDGGWNASGYASLMNLKEKYGSEVSYAEDVPQSDMEDVFRGYSVQGFDIIVGHGSQFTDAIVNVASDFPDTQFIIINGNDTSSENIACVQLLNQHTGFLMGSFAALMTETGTVGFIGGMDIPPITLGMQGFEAGAKFINPDIRVLATITGDAQDAARAKEQAFAFIDQGADILGHVANNAGLGVLEAAAESEIKAVGSMIDQYSISPDTVLVSVLNNNELLYEYFYDRYLNETLGQEIYQIGVEEGAVALSSYHQHETDIPVHVREEMDRVTKAIISGELSL